jgi:serine/threonine protein kinase
LHISFDEDISHSVEVFMEKTFGKYRIAALVDAKSTSSVYIARLPKAPDWNMVIKVFDTVLLETPQEQDDFMREMQVFAQLQHASILPILDVGIEKGHPYVVSKHISGGSLRQHLMRQSPPDITAGVRIISRIGSALHYAHARGIVHNNIKPENIVFDDNGAAFLVDFSFPVIQRKLPMAFSPDALNQYYLQTEPASQQSDQYALASLGYEILQGQRSSVPAALLTAKELRLLEDIVPPSPANPAAELPLHIEQALRNATAHNPDERYKDVATFINALNVVPEQFVESALTSPTPEGVVLYANTGEVLLDDTVATNFPQGRKHFLQSKWVIGTFLALIVALILSSYYILLPVLSAKSVKRIVLAQVNATASVPVTDGTGVIPTPTISTATSPQTGKVSTLPVNVAATPGATPIPQPTSMPSATPIPQPTSTPIPQATPIPTATPVPVCTVSYVVVQQWSRGFTTNIVISNTSSNAINGWMLVFTFPHYQRITQGWNGNFSQQGSQVTITNLSYNSSIGAQGSVQLGFNASWIGSNPHPDAFTLNGLPCGIG